MGFAVVKVIGAPCRKQSIVFWRPCNDVVAEPRRNLDLHDFCDIQRHEMSVKQQHAPVAMLVQELANMAEAAAALGDQFSCDGGGPLVTPYLDRCTVADSSY